MELKQHITDEKTGISYTLQGNYYLPDLVLPEQESFSIGKYGRMHRRYLKEHRKAYYSTLLTSCKLNEHLHEVDELCNALMERLTKELVKQEGVTEALKAKDQMEWVRRMENIRNRVEEITLAEYVYVR